MENVILSIFVPPSDYFNTSNSVEIYKSFDSSEDFGLIQVTEAYDNLNNGKEIYFLGADNNPVKVFGIEKEQYNGRIYDVDVENDIVFVRRIESSELGVWSGNSDSLIVDVFDNGISPNITGKFSRLFSVGGFLERLFSMGKITGMAGFSVQEVSFDRDLDCHRCGEHKAPEYDGVNITVEVSGVGDVSNAVLIDYYPSVGYSTEIISCYSTEDIVNTGKQRLDFGEEKC